VDHPNWESERKEPLVSVTVTVDTKVLVQVSLSGAQVTTVPSLLARHTTSRAHCDAAGVFCSTQSFTHYNSHNLMSAVINTLLFTSDELTTSSGMLLYEST